MFRRILIVCIGNICRSPMAEAVLADRVRGNGIRVESAGLGALVGHPADPIAVELLRERGLDLSGHRARQLTPEMILESNLVLVMDAAQQRTIEAMLPSARGRVHRIGRRGGFEVPDPYRRGRPAFEEALRLIDQGVENLALMLPRASGEKTLRKVAGC